MIGIGILLIPVCSKLLFLVGRFSVSIGGRTVPGLLDATYWTLFATAAPATIVGVWGGVAAYRRVDERTFRYIVLTLLLIPGAVLIATNI